MFFFKKKKKVNTERIRNVEAEIILGDLEEM